MVLTATKEIKTTVQEMVKKMMSREMALASERQEMMDKFESVEKSVTSLTERQAEQESLKPLLRKMMVKVTAIESLIKPTLQKQRRESL